MIEWYDFYVFVSLATILSTHFFPAAGGNAGLLSVLGIFATGMIVRPFGAVIFGRMGDLVGRKHTFLLTLVLMGVCSTAIGLLPGYRTIGVLAPVLMIALRLVQGLALGGEYGGAATYVAENAPVNRRGFFTSFIQITASVGLLVSLLLILLLRNQLGEEAFVAWGWRIPFLLSGILVVFSYLVRRTMAESPVFARMKAAGTTSKNPLYDSFANPENRRKVLIVLFGLTAGQGVVWHAGHLYALTFLQASLNIAMPMANKIMAWALVAGAPFFIVFGALSDRIGRKRIIMAGMLLAIVSYIPIYSTMHRLATFDDLNHDAPIMTKSVTRGPDGNIQSMTRKIEMRDDNGVVEKSTFDVDPQHPSVMKTGKPSQFTITVPPRAFWLLVGLIWIQVIFATMVYGPMAALLVELFPPRIRYTSLSVPYHLGNGLFGGVVPLVSTWIVSVTGFAAAGILYPTSVALLTLAVGSVCVKEPKPGANEDGED